MVDGDVVDNDGGEDGEEILLPGVESRTNLTPEMKIVVAAELRIANQPLLLGLRVFLIYDGLSERDGRDDARGAQGFGWRAQGVGAPPGAFGPSWPLSSRSKAQSASPDEKLAWYFSPNLFPAKIAREKTLLKTASDSAVFIQVW